MSKLHLFINDICEFFAKSDNIFSFLAIHNLIAIHVHLRLIWIINIFSTTFVGLDNQQHNKPSPHLQHVVNFYGARNTCTAPRSISIYWHDLTECGAEMPSEDPYGIFPPHRCHTQEPQEHR